MAPKEFANCFRAYTGRMGLRIFWRLITYMNTDRLRQGGRATDHKSELRLPPSHLNWMIRIPEYVIFVSVSIWLHDAALRVMTCGQFDPDEHATMYRVLLMHQIQCPVTYCSVLR